MTVSNRVQYFALFLVCLVADVLIWIYVLPISVYIGLIFVVLFVIVALCICAMAALIKMVL